METKSVREMGALETPEQVADFIRSNKVRSLLLVAQMEDYPDTPHVIVMNGQKDFLEKAVFCYETFMEKIVLPAFGYDTSGPAPRNRSERRRQGRRH